jgi:hypothetical protein
VVVDEAVASALRELSPTRVEVFVASCAERMSQIFTGLRGTDPLRGEDIDNVVRLLGALWDADASADVFQGPAESLSRFPELQPSDEEVVDVTEIYSFYAVLVLRYAAQHRVSGDSEAALQCAHACLTAMGQLDQNLSGSALFAQEAECQRRVVSQITSEEPSPELLSRLRDSDRTISRERLAAVLGRPVR